MNEIIETSNIEDMIYEIRGKQVMLDSDLAILYNTETKVLNQSVKRNINRFPTDFYFQLTKEEYNNLKSQNVTSSLENKYGGRRYKPYVFTELGISMLSSVLKSKVAIDTSIKIIRAFVSMRKFLYTNKNIIERITTVEYKIIEHDDKFNKLFIINR